MLTSPQVSRALLYEQEKKHASAPYINRDRQKSHLNSRFVD